jgi:N6-L-threonylcarbamoyladenine synthase
MKILAIETSCDETGIAVVEGQILPAQFGVDSLRQKSFEFKVLSNALLSQAALHAEYGGVYPNLAKREHEKNLPVILKEALGDFSPKDFDAIAVTVGPGLEPALWTGITFAQKLAEEWQLPLLPVNHMEGHLISSLARRSLGEGGLAQKIHSGVLENTRIEFILENVQFPVLGLLISGGHTEFVHMRDWFEYQIIGETLDDAVGEAFDKVARMLELAYPGGPEISKLADRARASQKITSHSPSVADSVGVHVQQLSAPLKLPRPMLNSKNCDLSFSGLKTAALYALKNMGGVEKLSEDEKAAFAREFEDSVAEVFVAKTRRALNETDAKTFVIGGGVAANRYIREQLQKLILDEFPDVEMRLPELSITGDNAIMIAEAALTHLLSGDWTLEKKDFQEIRAVGNLRLSNN